MSIICHKIVDLGQPRTRENMLSGTLVQCLHKLLSLMEEIYIAI